MRHFAIVLLCWTFAALGETHVVLAQIRVSETDGDQSVAELVECLWSSDQARRQAAKWKLVELGTASVPALLSLLEDIDTNPRKKRFPIGREDEARQALAHYQDLSPEYPSTVEISSRLRDDAAALLGELRAVAAVPILIKLMHRQVEAAWPRGLSTVMRALARMRPAAVPALIEEIENAPKYACSQVLLAEGAQRHTPEPDAEHDEPIGLAREVAIIRIRAALVLGEIGDERALPVLERLLNTTTEPQPMEIEMDWFKHAIRRIKENRGNGRSSK